MLGLCVDSSSKGQVDVTIERVDPNVKVSLMIVIELSQRPHERSFR